FIFRGARKSFVPENHFPIKRPAFHPERCSETAVRFVSIHHINLESMPGNQFVMYDRSGKMRIVSAETHHLRIVSHRVCWICDEQGLTAEEEGCNELPLGAHHHHVPGFFREWWYGEEIVLLQEVDRFLVELHYHFRLSSFGHV